GRQPGYLGVARHPRQLDDWPDFDCAPARRWNPSGDRDGLVEILSLYHVVAAELLARLRKWTVSDEPLAVAHSNAGRRRCRVQWSGGQIMSARTEIVGELHGLYVALRPLRFVQCLFVKVNQHHVSHLSSSIDSIERTEPEST